MANKEIRVILKKSNSLGWKIVSTSTSIFDIKNKLLIYIFSVRWKQCLSIFTS